MKKTLAVAIAVLLCVLGFAGCEKEPVEPPAFEFAAMEEGLPVKRLVIEDGTGRLEGVGYVQQTVGRFCLTGEYMNGEPKQDGELYYYMVPEALISLRKRENVDGVLLFDGVPYGAVVADDGVELLYTLDDAITAQTWTAFFNEALNASK